jgi:hypothetical protein
MAAGENMNWHILDIDGHFLAMNTGELIDLMAAFSEKARREGLLALEDEIDGQNIRFIVKMLQLVVDGNDPVIVESVGEHYRHNLCMALGDIYACLQMICENRADPDIDSMIDLYMKTSDLVRFKEYLRAAKNFFTKIPADGDGSGESAGAVMSMFREIAHLEIPEEEKHVLYENLMATSLAQAEHAYMIIIHGMMGIQAGHNPRVLREILDAIAGIKWENEPAD